MPSRIDPSKPQDDMPAAKSDLRASLAFAKSEIEHMGFFDPEAGVTGKEKVEEILADLTELSGLLQSNAQRLAALEGI